MDIGKVLQDARIAKNLSLDTVSQDTNIRKKYLDAIEKNDYDALPGAVFVKGIMRTYGNYLGLDGARLVEEFKSSVSGNAAVINNNTIRETKDVRVRPSFKSNRDIGSGTDSNKKTVIRIVCALVVILMAGFALFYYLNRSGQGWNVSFPFVFLNPAGQKNETPESGKSSSSQGGKETVADTGSGKEPVYSAASASTANQKDEPVEGTVGSAGIGQDKPDVTELTLTSRGKCWLRVSDPKGTVLYEGTLLKGETRHFSAGGSIVVNIGNMKDLQIEHNRKVLPFEDTKEPVIRTYGPSGKEQK